MSDEPTDPVELIEARVAERFHGDESLTFEAARWAALSAATEAERDAYLTELLYVRDELLDAEREARLQAHIDGVVAEAIRPKEQKQ